ncbi:hypothetical protein BDV3_000716 [Batrachochytrium dendrobatidis]
MKFALAYTVCLLTASAVAVVIEKSDNTAFVVLQRRGDTDDSQSPSNSSGPSSPSSSEPPATTETPDDLNEELGPSPFQRKNNGFICRAGKGNRGPCRNGPPGLRRNGPPGLRRNGPGLRRGGNCGMRRGNRCGIRRGGLSGSEQEIPSDSEQEVHSGSQEIPPESQEIPSTSQQGDSSESQQQVHSESQEIPPESQQEDPFGFENTGICPSGKLLLGDLQCDEPTQKPKKGIKRQCKTCGDNFKRRWSNIKKSKPKKSLDSDGSEFGPEPTASSEDVNDDDLE